MSGAIHSCVCCDEVTTCGLSEPRFDEWLVNRGDFVLATDYIVGDLVQASSGVWYICNTDHTSSAANQPPNVSFWDEGHRVAGCLYIQVENIGLGGCFVAFGERDINPATETQTVRYRGSSSEMFSKWMSRPVLFGKDDGTGGPNLQFLNYNGPGGGACYWLVGCNCVGDDTSIVAIKSTRPSGEGTGFADEYITSSQFQFTTLIEFTSKTTVRARIFGVGIVSGSDAVNRKKPSFSDTPCFGFAGRLFGNNDFSLLFDGTDTVPDPWLDDDGKATSTITISNDLSCGDIGDYVNPSLAAQCPFCLLSWKMAGGGTIKLVAPFAANWQDDLGDGLGSCASTSAPSNATCDNEGRPNEEDPDPTPGIPGIPGLDGPGDTGNGPLPLPPPPGKRVWCNLRRCDNGAQTFKFVDRAKFQRGSSLKIGGTCYRVACDRVIYKNSPPGNAIDDSDIQGFYRGFDAGGGGADSCKECQACCICGDCAFAKDSITVSYNHKSETLIYPDTEDCTGASLETSTTVDGTLDFKTCGEFSGTVTVHEIDETIGLDETTEETRTIIYNCETNVWEGYDTTPTTPTGDCSGISYEDVDTSNCSPPAPSAKGTITMSITVNGNADCDPP